MFNKKSFFVLAALILVCFLGVSAANAQDPTCPYTLASLQGAYAGIGNYGANVAISLGVRNYDGNGNLTSIFVVNEPTAGSTTGARTLVPGTQTGTYTVNCNGTGTTTRFLTLANGTKATGVDDFVITAAMKPPPDPSVGVLQQGVLIATAMTDAQRTPSAIVPGGIFLIRMFTRLP